MTTVKEILEFLFYRIAPEEEKYSWDNVGLLLGRSTKPVTKILVSLDATKEVAAEAKRLGCELVVTHHPIIFHPAKHITDEPDSDTVLTYLENRIAVISMHTNLDRALDGVNEILAAKLELEEIMTLEDDTDADLCHLIRTGFVPNCALPDFAARVRMLLGCPGIRYADGGKPVRHVAVGGGACGSFIEFVADAGIDTFVTADLGYHDFQKAAAYGLNLIDAGHFETENPVCGYLLERISAAFPEVEVLLSAHKDCVLWM